MRTQAVITAIDELTVERGEKIKQHYYATFYCKDVLDHMKENITKGNLRYIAYIVTKGYPESTLTGQSGERGKLLNIKIRHR